MTEQPADKVPATRWRYEFLIVSAVLLALICGLFWKAVFTGRVMSGADPLLAISAPWTSAPQAANYLPENALLRDQCLQFIPWRHFTVECLRSGTLPLWNPYAFCGSPFVANDQSAVFFPLSALYLFLPFHVATLLSAILRLYIAGIGMHYLLKRFGVRPGPALVGAVGFMFCGFNIVWLNHPHASVSVFLPLVLLLTDKFISDTPRGLWAGLWALVVGVQFLGGHVETSVFILIPCALFFVYRVGAIYRRERSWKSLWRPVAAGALASILGIMIGAVQLLPTLEYVGNSAVSRERSAGQTLKTHDVRFNPLHFAPIAMPELYGTPVRAPFNYDESFFRGLGLVNYNERTGAYVGVALLLLGALFLTRRSHLPHTGFFVVLLLLSLSLAYHVPGIYHIIVAIPGIALIQPALARFQLLVGFSICVLGAYGLDMLITSLNSATAPAGRVRALAGRLLFPVALVMSLGAFLAAMGFFLYDGPGFSRTRALLQPTVAGVAGFPAHIAFGFVSSTGLLLATVLLCVLLVALAPRVLGRRLWAAWLVLVAAELLVFAYGYNPIVDRGLVLPETPSVRFLQDNAGHERICSSFGVLQANLATAYGLRDVSGYDAITPADLKSLLTGLAALPDARDRVTGTKYRLSASADPAIPGRLAHSGDLYVYEIDNHASRLRLVGQAQVFAGGDSQRILPALGAPGFDPRRTVVIYEEGRAESAQTVGAPGPAGSAEFIDDGINDVTIRAHADRDGWLVLADTYFPGWHVSVDGKEAKLLRANFAFRAVALAPGEHVVKFSYRPISFLIGAILSLAGLAACAVWMFLGCRRRRA